MADETSPNAPDVPEPDRSEPTEERKAELRAAYQEGTDAPYQGVEIRTLGELLWIFAERGWSVKSRLPIGMARPNLTKADLRRATLSGANLDEATLSEANLSLATLSGANLHRATLSGANLIGATLSGANLIGATLSKANLIGATLSKANLSLATLSEANFQRATLSEANLSGATLSGANLYGATLSGANLVVSNLEDADLREATLSGANLSRSLLSTKTTLDGVQLQEKNGKKGEPPFLLGTRWNGAPLDGIDWNQLQPARLGDEARIGKATNRQERVQAYRDAVRAYHGLVMALEDQGLAEPARRFRQRERTLERRALRASPSTWGAYLFYSLLNLISGQGEEPQRIFVAYGLIISTFTALYWAVSNFFATSSRPLLWYEALVLSLSSFHGRGFFPSQIGLGDPLAIIAAFEAVIGLFIELILIATFSNRFLTKG